MNTAGHSATCRTRSPAKQIALRLCVILAPVALAGFSPPRTPPNETDTLMHTPATPCHAPATSNNALNGPLSFADPPLVAGLRATEGAKQRQVGLFYFLWLGGTGRHAPYNISKIVEADPQAGYKPDDAALWGGVGTYHHWGEPLYGYYYSDDEWVVRRHMKLLIAAHIDFLFFDTTNADIYADNARLVMRILDEYRRDGWDIPKVMFYTNTDSGATVQRIYDAVYAPAYMPETWFRHEGKPLIIAKRDECPPALRDFFTLREAQWPNEPAKPGGWPWMDFTRPQRVFTDFEGRDEVLNVSVAQHPQERFGDSVLYGETRNRGRAFHDGRNDPAPDAYAQGYNFVEQFERAIEADPPVLLVTGWNEWIAGRWPGPPDRPLMFVDCANTEYSRDLEMMRGGYGDTCYRQLIACVRKYKQIPDQPRALAPGQTAEFRTFTDDDIPRNHPGYGTVYTNHTARNIPAKLTVTHHGDTVTFTITTKENIKPSTPGDAWLRLYLTLRDTGDRYVVTRTGLAKLTIPDDLQTVQPLRDIPCRLTPRTIAFDLPADLLRGHTLALKAADSTTAYTRPIDFYDTGSTAPPRRFVLHPPHRLNPRHTPARGRVSGFINHKEHKEHKESSLKKSLCSLCSLWLKKLQRIRFVKIRVHSWLKKSRPHSQPAAKMLSYTP